MLDLSAAFDVVDHGLLLKKLCLYGFKDDALDWIQSYLTDRTQSVCIDGTQSSFLKILTGVSRSILGPLFYILFTKDLPEVIYSCQNHVRDEDEAPWFQTHCSYCESVCCFADDSTLSLSGPDPKALSDQLEEKYACFASRLHDKQQT